MASEIESANLFYLGIIDPGVSDEKCISGIEARDAAIALAAKREVLDEIEALQGKLDEARAQVAGWVKHQEICSGQDDNDTPTELDRLNPFARHWKRQERPTTQPEEFIHGIRYYAGMLEDGDSWWHSLGHVESLCRDFQTAIDARRKPASDPKPEGG